MQDRIGHHVLRRPDPPDHLGDARRQGSDQTDGHAYGDARLRDPDRRVLGAEQGAQGVVQPVRGVASVLAALQRGIGFHETTTYIHTKSIGSHGCVNLLPSDARAFYDLGKVGSRVYVFGRRPGT
ncbi:L,D-transpeptidase [Phytohabitans suffuscus]|uniref:L,D-transpeptidase n=1 Tax=Phytohabitans suffuscus TaxID=624315 RepID=UPI0038CD3BFD